MVAAQKGESQWLQRVGFYCVLAGFMPLVPVPFMDDILLGRVRRRCFEGLFEDSQRPLSSGQLSALFKSSGCPLGCVFFVFVYPIKKIFKKIFFFLSIKDCVDEASKLFHQAYLFQHALDSGALGPQATGAVEDASLKAAESAINQTLAQIDPRPINQSFVRLFAGSRRAMRKSVRALIKKARQSKAEAAGKGAIGEAIEKAAHESEDSPLKGMVEEMGSDVMKASGYLDTLTATFDERLSAAAAANAPPGPDAGGREPEATSTSDS